MNPALPYLMNEICAGILSQSRGAPWEHAEKQNPDPCRPQPTGAPARNRTASPVRENDAHPLILAQVAQLPKVGTASHPRGTCSLDSRRL